MLKGTDMSMLHDDDESLMENTKAKGGFILGCILAVSGVILVLLLTFAVNKKPENTVKKRKSVDDDEMK